MVTFEGQKLPKYITMFYVSHPVSPYVSRASLCHSCFRFGHIKDNCKSQPRCVHCGEKGHSFSKNHCPCFEEAPRCVNCKENHRADASNCPEFAIQEEIREYAAHRNLTLRDASKVIRATVRILLIASLHIKLNLFLWLLSGILEALTSILHSVPGKFRPISLISCSLKIMEKLILLRLDWWIEHNHKLPSSQYGFRKFRSCQDNLSILTTEINTSFVRRKVTACLFLDLSNAFDDVIPSILISDLKEMGLPSTLCTFIYNLIHFRRLQFVFNGELSGEYSSHKDVPQGSILSPLLFNIYVAKLKKCIGEDCEIIQFADDIAIYTSARDIQQALIRLENSANRAYSHLSSRGLKVAPAKSALIIFTKKHINLLAYSITVNNTVIQSTTSHKFLGIHLDFRLSEELGGEAALARSWFKAIRLCLGLRKTTPTNIILAEAGEGPLISRFYFLTAKYILKIFSLDTYPAVDKLYGLLWYSRNSPVKDPSEKFLLFKAFRNLRKHKTLIAKFDFPAVMPETGRKQHATVVGRMTHTSENRV
ncbi:pol-like protein, partial [Lasius niger]